MLWILLGTACAVYTAVELTRAAKGSPPGARFGAVQRDSGQPLEVVLDRRTRSQPRLVRLKRRSADG